MEHRVVVTGMGVVSPNGTGLEAFKGALEKGQSGIRYLSEMEERKFGCRIAGVPEDISGSLEKAPNKDELEKTTESIKYVSVAASEAWQDAGFDLATDTSPVDWDTGAVIGTGIGDMETIVQKIVPMVNKGQVRRMGSRIVEQVMNSASSAHIAGLLGLGGQVTSNSSACGTGTEAIIEAARKIRQGQAQRMVAGASEGPSVYTWAGFDSMRVLAKKFNKDPEKGSRPMSASACGFVPGSGAGVLVLEDLDTARKRNARIYAEILGAHLNCGGQKNGGSMTAPNPEGVRRCIQGAIQDAGVHSRDIDAVNGHLSATFADPHEVINWAAALNRSPHEFPLINGTKSLIGHCLGAAGAIEAVASILQLAGGFLHPSINCEDLHPELAPFSDRVVRKALDYPELSVLAKASFGFGDVNSCLIMKKWTEVN